MSEIGAVPKFLQTESTRHTTRCIVIADNCRISKFMGCTLVIIRKESRGSHLFCDGFILSFVTSFQKPSCYSKHAAPSRHYSIVALCKGVMWHKNFCLDVTPCLARD